MLRSTMQIGPVTLFKFDSIIDDWNRHLSCHFEVLIPKLLSSLAKNPGVGCSAAWNGATCNILWF